MPQVYHIPVMLKESVDALCIKSGGIYVDATYGGGGHSREIWGRLKNGRLIAIDQDSEAAANAIKDKRFSLIQNNFRFIRGLVRSEGIEAVDGILADLGVSSHQFDTRERGFSFRFDAPLDMRMNNKSSLTAAKLVNTYSEEQLRYILTVYGEIDNVGRVVKLLMAERERKAIHTTGDLVEVLKPCLPKMMEHKYLAKIFQSLRMEINREMAALEQFLEQSLKLLKPSGRLAVITYHSLEDRLVKNFMRSGDKKGTVAKDFFGNETTPFKVITKKAITPTEEEIKNNTRARSAKLRVAEKI
ncbi:MAG: 16S rRNA (cytosine(1402)-N(4))-methyltransferase RsmH [Bacteroidales bacterium]|nr:16S rRNA (cytosine(1402)-N(4))-methyltransferase RsmH [Bacteroidales bacterium]MCL2133227.1 16S rRNA (cytosine(1402)-N(4))-methyltransferase RsmH [Bacteroidales bacterium]MCL2133587.1 16S rRNA (cytosine(1402)-N(4))-methyltransferase RsmH [Bacteroidales bacterium]